jgi:dephospho-CoA kinase
MAWLKTAPKATLPKTRQVVMKQEPTVVAITGGIGSGKSAVAAIFAELGAVVIDADILARQVVEPGTPGLQEIRTAFPKEALILADGSLNRSKLAEIIFSNPEKKKVVESILHPKIRALWLSKLEGLRRTDVSVVAYVVPLLFESSVKMPELKKIVLVSAPEEVRIERVMKRDGSSRAMVELRLKAQLSESEKVGRSDFVIPNNSTFEELKKHTTEVFSKILDRK